MAGNFYDKFPDEVVEFDLDASDILLNGDAIESVQVVALDGGITVSDAAFAQAIISFRVHGGTAGSVAHAVAKVTLTSGQFREGPLSIVIKRLPGA